MARLLKISLSIFAVLVTLVIIAVVVVPLIINPNDFKPEIQAAVKDNLGRELQIEGDLELSVFPWVGISTGKLVLSNAKGFPDKPFAEIAASNLKVKLLPLFSKEVEVSRVVLKGLVLNLAKNKKGVSNWDDLAGSNKTQSKEELKVAEDASNKEDGNVTPLAALAIGGVSIEQAKIVWDDQQKKKYIEINDFNFKTGKLIFDEAIDIDLSLSVFNKEPELTETLSFTTGLIISENLKQFTLNDIQLKSKTTGKGFPDDGIAISLLAEMALDLAQQTVEVKGLNINTGSMNLSADISGTQIIDKPVFKGPIKIAEFNLSKLMTSMAMPLPKMQASDALSKLSLAFNLLATDRSADIQALNIRLDQTSITGSASIVNFDKPKIAFNIIVDAIDVDRYLAPAKEGESKPAVVTPATAAAASANLLPVETLRALNANGQLLIEKMKINKLNMQGLSLKIKAENGLVKTEQHIKQLYQGGYTGNTIINVKNKTPIVSLNEKVTNVSMEPLLKDMQGEARMSGVVNASANIRGRGNSTAAMKSSLNGTLDFSFKEGVIRGFNLQKIIDSGKSLIEGTPLPTDNKSDQTVFSVIKGSANIKNGFVSNRDLYAEASKLRVNGQGTASIVTEKLDYKINAKLLKKLATETEPENIKGVPLVVNIGGSLSKPTYTLDIAAMLIEKNRAKIDKKIDKVIEKLNLDEKLGPGINNLIKGLF